MKLKENPRTGSASHALWWIKEKEDLWATSAEIGFHYAREVLNGRFLAGELTIVASPWFAPHYFKMFVRDPRAIVGENYSIATNRDVLRLARRNLITAQDYNTNWASPHLDSFLDYTQKDTWGCWIDRHYNSWTPE